MLITLGIIGVVAALTIPTVISTYKEKAILSQLKKTYSVLVNAVALSEIDNGEMINWPTGAEMEMYSYFAAYWKPYLKGAEICNTTSDCGYPADFNSKIWTNDKSEWTVITDKSRVLFRLADGAIIFIPRNTSDLVDGVPVYVTFFYIDVNGSKGPNKGGIDVFKLSRNTEKGIVPYDDRNTSCSEKISSNCLKKIMENGWKIPDDYPFKF